MGLLADIRKIEAMFISIHPPREGWDVTSPGGGTLAYAFQSTHPVRGGTRRYGRMEKIVRISIHPPREGWDLLDLVEDRRSLCISIHPPREGWDSSSSVSSVHGPRFQSTHPVRGGTNLASAEAASSEISIHPPREGWDSQVEKGLACLTDFNPPTP